MQRKPMTSRPKSVYVTKVSFKDIPTTVIFDPETPTEVR